MWRRFFQLIGYERGMGGAMIKSVIKRICALTGILAIALLPVFRACAAESDAAGRRVFHMPQRAPLLAEPSLSSYIVGYISEGQDFRVLSETMAWSFIEIQAGMTPADTVKGYLLKLFAGIEEAVATRITATDIRGSLIPLRNTPSEDSEIAGAYYAGVEVSVLAGGSGKYERVRVGKGSAYLEGYIDRANLAEHGEPSGVDTVVAAMDADNAIVEILGVSGEYYHTSRGFIRVDDASAAQDSRVLASDTLYTMSDIPKLTLQWIDTGRANIGAVRTLDENGATLQIISAKCVTEPGAFGTLFVEDVNFDGAADIRIATASLDADNTYLRYTFWLYDTITDRFIPSPQFDSLGANPTFDALTKKIRAVVINSADDDTDKGTDDEADEDAASKFTEREYVLINGEPSPLPS